MISSSLNFCVPPLSTRFIHHHHDDHCFKTDQEASLSMLSKYLRVRRERPQYFATSHPDLARFEICCKTSENIPQTSQSGQVLNFEISALVTRMRTNIVTPMQPKLFDPGPPLQLESSQFFRTGNTITKKLLFMIV